MLIQTPNTSLFPEIDIASKITTDGTIEAEAPGSLPEILWPLSNAGSIVIRRALEGIRFFVRFADNELFQEDGSRRRVVIKSRDNGMLLGNKTVDDEKSTIADDNTAYQAEPILEELRTVPYPRATPEMQMSRRYI